MQIPVGTRLTVHARANKDLVRVQIDTRPRRTRPCRRRCSGRRIWSTIRARSGYTLATSRRRHDAAVHAFGRRRHHEPRAGAAALAVVADEPPQMAVRLDGIGTAITPQARLPAVGQVTDDYGVARSGSSYAVDGADAVAMPIDLAGGSSGSTESDGRLDRSEARGGPAGWRLEAHAGPEAASSASRPPTAAT